MKGILKSRPVTPEVIVDNVNIVEKSKVVADKALNLLNPYRHQHSDFQQWQGQDGFGVGGGGAWYEANLDP